MAVTTRERSKISTQEPTRYEVVVRCGEIEERLGFTPRVSYRGLQPYVSKNVDRLLELVPAGTRVFRGRLGGRLAFTIGPAVVGFSGRTEREVAGQD